MVIAAMHIKRNAPAKLYKFVCMLLKNRRIKFVNLIASVIETDAQ